MTTNLPSTAQMVNRSNSGHQSALRAISEGRPVLRADAFASEIRGMRTVLATLSHWGTVEPVGETLALTARGVELLAALEARSQGAKR